MCINLFHLSIYTIYYTFMKVLTLLNLYNYLLLYFSVKYFLARLQVVIIFHSGIKVLQPAIAITTPLIQISK